MAGGEGLDQEVRLAVYEDGSRRMVALSGRLRLSNCECINRRVLSLISEPCERLYIELTGLSEVDSAGLGVLVGLHITSRKKGVQLTLLSPSEQLLRLIKATRLNQLFVIAPGEEARTIKAELEQEQFALPATPMDG